MSVRDAAPGWLAAVNTDYADSGKLTVEIAANGRYFIHGQEISLHDMCFIKEKGMFPENTQVVLVARPGATHGDVQPAIVVMNGQYWKMVFKTEETSPTKPSEATSQ